MCSGIEAASVAWNPIGWKAAWFSEIEPFPCAVLAHHYPDVPNLGDMTTIAARVRSGEVEAPELLCGGTPCQAFSVAGLREGLADPRGGLTLAFVDIANAIDEARERNLDEPCIVFWENVPGVLSSKDNAFGCFLSGLAGESAPFEPPGGRWKHAGCVLGPQRAIAWRTLDAQFFGLAQRRKRVFVVASARDGFDPLSVLFEREGMRRDFAPERRPQEEIAGGAESGAGERGLAVTPNERERSLPSIVGCLSDGAHYGGGLNGQDAYSGRIIPGGTNAEGADGFTLTTSNLGKTVNNQTPLVVHETH